MEAIAQNEKLSELFGMDLQSADQIPGIFEEKGPSEADRETIHELRQLITTAEAELTDEIHDRILDFASKVTALETVPETGLLKKYFDECRQKNILPPELEGKLKGNLFDDMKS